MYRQFDWPHENYYWDVKETDVVDWLHPLLQRGWRWRYGDGKITNVSSYADEVPWHYIRFLGDDCWFSNHVVFDIIQQRVGEKWVPSRCQECWKTVIYPKTLKQLFALEKVMMHDPRVKRHSCKCGIEARPITPRLYGGYAYAKSLEKGRLIFKDFRAAVDDHPDLGPDVKMILKRGCTEMEAACGPSDKWQITPKQKFIEDLVASKIAFEPNEALQSDHHLRHTHRLWIEWACANGDETYKEYTGGKSIHGEYVTYHEEKLPQRSVKKEKKNGKSK